MDQVSMYMWNTDESTETWQ